MNFADAPLVWLDLEMTGLDPHTCAILEVAVLLTGPDLVPRAEYEAVVWQPEEVLARMEPVVREMHTRNGLLEKVRTRGQALRRVELELMRVLTPHMRAGEGLLAGSSIHTDRRFLIHHLPMVERYLNYRMVDVSSLKVLVQAWYPGAPEPPRSPREQAAMSDIRASLAELIHYRDTVFRRAEDVPRHRR